MTNKKVKECIAAENIQWAEDFAKRKLKFAGHIIRGQDEHKLARLVMEGLVEGKKDRGRQRRVVDYQLKFPDDLAERAAEHFANHLNLDTLALLQIAFLKARLKKTSNTIHHLSVSYDTSPSTPIPPPQPNLKFFLQFQTDTGQKLYEQYVAEMINGNVSIWAPVHKENIKMYTSGNNNCTVKIRDKSIDLKETKDLYGRLMVLARSSRDVDQKEAIGNLEFTLTPRALFAPSGSLLPCNDKSKLILALTNLVPKETTQTPIIPDKKIAVIDGMVLV
ncbi:hypothetical protein GQR58_016271 [Nymphon striatum]|nr:hypothetical protein GQR58_016271 [Nymphon striatum]